jgi:serine/threonine-protein kinase
MVVSKTAPYTVAVGLPAPDKGLANGALVAERYQVGEVLGRGGFGAVHRAYDTLLRAPVAIKVLGCEQTLELELPRVAREVRLARSVRHPNVCAVYDLASEAGQWFITMELAQGTLSDELRSPGPPPDWERRAQDALDVCEGLAAVHAAEVAHRDLKPSNVLRMANGRLAIGDFGLALSAFTRTLLPGGAPRYLAPEVVAGASSDRCSDVWQLGMVCHEILLRRPPQWLAPAGGLPAPVVPTTGLPAPAAALMPMIARCLSWSRETRPASALSL